MLSRTVLAPSPLPDLVLTAGALAIEATFGYPDALFRAIRHPVVWMGAALGLLERRLNRPGRWRRGLGVLTTAAMVAVAAVPSAALQALLPLWATAVLAASLPAQRSLHTHVRAVLRALDAGGVEAGRRAVSHIVGRDTAALDEAGVVRAAMESLAENFSDGVVAPAFWGAVAGLPGMAAYKAINTADSMVGHRSERFAAFGWGSARLDDLVNLPASRLAALWLVLAAALCAAHPAGAWRAVRRDARRHRSPNAGWPEAAMAGALGVRLAGPRAYGGAVVDDAWMGDGRLPGRVDLGRALRLYRVACGLQLAVVTALAALAWALR